MDKNPDPQDRLTNKNKFWFPGSGSGSFSRKGVENCNNPCKID